MENDHKTGVLNFCWIFSKTIQIHTIPLDLALGIKWFLSLANEIASISADQIGFQFSHFRFWMIFSKMRFWNSELHNLYPKQSQIEVWFSNLSLSELKKLGVYNVHKTKPIFITPKSALFSPFLALIKHFWRKTVLTSKILMLRTQHKIVYGEKLHRKQQ